MSSSVTDTSATATAPNEAVTAPYFEDFEVGEVFTGSPKTFSADVVAAFAQLSGDRAPLHTEHGHTPDGRPLVHGPLALAGFFGWHYDLGLSGHVEAAFDTEWDFVAPIYVGDSVSYEMTVTRARRSSALRNGVIGRHVVVRNQRGTLVQQGRTAALVTARSAVDDTESRVGHGFPTLAWGEALTDRLATSSSFVRATSTWDGTIGLRFGTDNVAFRIYRGQVLECATRTPNAPTFTLGAADVTWARLITGPVNDFTKRAMQDEFSVAGSAYEYLRMNAAIIALIDEARALAGSAGQEGGNR